MPIAHDADPWVRPPLRNQATSIYGIRRDGPGPQEDYSFADLLDIINPLQHIPIVSSIYRELTGDEIKPSAQIFGATLYGGPIGLIASTSMAVVQEAAGGSPADLMVASLLGGGEPETAADREDVAAAQADAELPPAGGPAAAAATATPAAPATPAASAASAAGPAEPLAGPLFVPPAGPLVVPGAGPLVQAPAGSPPGPSAGPSAAPLPEPAPAAAALAAAEAGEPPAPRAAPFVIVEAHPLPAGQMPPPEPAPSVPAPSAPVPAATSLPDADNRTRERDAGSDRESVVGAAVDAAATPEFAARLLDGYDKYERLLDDRTDETVGFAEAQSPDV